MTDTNKTNKTKETKETKETINDLLRKAHGDKIEDKQLSDRDLEGIMNANEKFAADVKLMYELEAKLAEVQAPYEFAVRGMAMTEIVSDNIINTVAARGERTKELTENDRATLASAFFASMCAKLNPELPDQETMSASVKISYAVAVHHPLVQYIAASLFMQSVKEKLVGLGMGVEGFTLHHPELKMTAKGPGK